MQLQHQLLYLIFSLIIELGSILGLSLEYMIESGEAESSGEAASSSE